MTPIVQLLKHTSSLLATPVDPGAWVLTINIDDSVNYEYVNSVVTTDSSILIASSQSFIKVNTQGQVINAKKLIHASSSNIINFNVFSDDSIGYCGSIGGPNNSSKLLMGLLNNTTSMTPQWTSSWGTTITNKVTFGYSIDKNITDNTYSVVGYGNNDGFVSNAVDLKIANNGTINAVRSYTYGGGSTLGGGLVEEKTSTDRYFITSNHLIKLNSTSGIIWQRQLPTLSFVRSLILFQNKIYFRGNAVSYCIVNPDGSTSGSFFIQFDSYSPESTGIAVDSSGIYLVATTYFDSEFFLVKLNLAGDTIIYCRRIVINNTETGEYYPTICIGGDYLYITSGLNTNSLLVLRYPKNGSLLLNTANVVIQSTTATVYSNSPLNTNSSTTQTTPPHPYAVLTNPTVGTPNNLIANKGAI